MFITSTYSKHVAQREVAMDVEVFPEDSEYQHVTECVQGRSQHQTSIRKVLRHQIPGSLYNGKACRVSWSVIADADGHTMHYTVYNCERTQRKAVSPSLTSAGFYLRASREVAATAH